MPYNLDRYKIQVGDKVEIVGRANGSSKKSVAGKVVAVWDFSKGNTGTVVDIWLPGTANTTPPTIEVEPDADFGDGRHTFTIHDVRVMASATGESPADRAKRWRAERRQQRRAERL